MLKDDEIVGDLPRTISRASWFFLRRGGRIVYRVTRKRKHDDGLEVTCACVYFGNVKMFTGEGIN